MLLEGIAIVGIGDWGYMVFLAAADSELPCFLILFPSLDLRHSSDDSACKRDVGPI